jgi:predicted aspartyl protease
MADSVRLTCWPSPDHLVIGIQIRNLAGKWHSEVEELVPLDTGYSEDILVPYTLFEELNLRHWRLFRPLSPRGTTVTGQVIEFIEARAEVIIPKTGEQHLVIVQTLNARFLIGRAFLRRFKVILDGLRLVYLLQLHLKISKRRKHKKALQASVGCVLRTLFPRTVDVPYTKGMPAFCCATAKA